MNERSFVFVENGRDERVFWGVKLRFILDVH